LLKPKGNQTVALALDPSFGAAEHVHLRSAFADIPNIGNR